VHESQIAINEKVRAIVWLAHETNHKKLHIIRQYIELIAELFHSRGDHRVNIGMLIMKAVRWVSVIKLPSVPTKVAFIYYYFGRVLLEVLVNQENGKICLSLALDSFFRNVPKSSSETFCFDIDTLEAVRYMMVHIDIDPEYLKLQDTEGNAFLHTICKHGDDYLDLAQYCIDKDVNTEGVNSTAGMNPLHLACVYNEVKMVQYLISRGAAVDARLKNGNTALMIACRNGFFNLVQRLIKLGAKVDTCNVHGWTALHMSTEYIGIVQHLLDHGADVNATCITGSTPLNHAIDEDRVKTVNYLIDRGADVGRENIYGMTALHHASAMGKCSIVAILMQNGANMDVANKDRMTALHLAVSFGHVDVVKHMFIDKINNVTTTKKCEGTVIKSHPPSSDIQLDILKHNTDQDSDAGDYIKENVGETLSYIELMMALQMTCGFSRWYSESALYRRYGSDSDEESDTDEELIITNSNNVDVMTTIQLAIESGHFYIVGDLIQKYA
jgi:ankyrin repeat protein